MQTKKVRAFKRRLEHYVDDLQCIAELEEKIELCFHKLGGYKGLDPSKEPIHAMPNKDAEWKIRADIERYEALKKVYESNIFYVNSVLDLIEEETREAIKKVYIQDNSFDSVARDMYISKSTLRDRIDARIKLALEKKED